MNQSQSQFHTSGYRGNQQGHDNSLRADAGSPSAFVGTPVTSQYRGLNKTFEPTGFVQSVYGQSNTNVGQTTPSYSQNQYGSSVNAGTYHTASYQGDQQGHDSTLRADSRQPVQSQFGTAYSSGYGAAGMSAGSSFSGMTSSSLGSQWGQQSAAPQSFHTASYRGDQEGHDSYLRSDSPQSTTSQFSGMTSGVGSSSYGTSSMGMSSMGSSGMGMTSGMSSMGSSGMGMTSGMSSMGSSGMGMTSGMSSAGTSGMGMTSGMSSMGSSGMGATSGMSSMGTSGMGMTQSYHTAGYRGDQPGHDNSLRADSRQPGQSQAGTAGSFGASSRMF